MTKTLVEPVLFSRDFGSQALRVRSLEVWAEARGLTIPPTIPSVADFDLVALESLLVAIERGVPTMQDDVVLGLAKAIPCDPGLRKLIEEGDTRSARWLVGANTQLQWRAVLATAIAKGQLQTVDALTGLPMGSPPELAHATLATVTTGIGPAVSTDNLCAGFDGVKFSSLEWRTKITKGAPDWLKACRASKGAGGASASDATWWPINVAIALLKGEPRGVPPSKAAIDTAFNTQRSLKPCRDAWFQHCQDHPEFG